MNSREKILSVAIGGIAAVCAVYFGWTKVDGMIQTRKDTIVQIEKEIGDYDLTLHRDRKLAEAMKEFRARALPVSEEDQRTYDRWINSAAEEAGIVVQEKKTPVRGRQLGSSAFVPYEFDIQGTGSLESLTKFLHKVYSSNDLHKITKWRLKPQPEAGGLDIELKVEAITIPDSPERSEVGNLPSDRLAGKDVNHFVSAITQRNLFSPANEAPVIEKIADQTAEKGKFLRVDVAEKASDPDKDDTLTYAIVEAPEGVSIDEKRGSLRWLPKKELELGDYTIEVSVTDSSTPAKTATTKFTVALKDPPAPVKEEKPVERPPRFDEAKHAYLTAVVAVNDRPSEAWVHVRTSGKMYKLLEGDEVKIGTIEGTLTKIGLKAAEIQTKDELLIIPTGKPLVSDDESQDPRISKK
ncbi:MAG: hypothetical protein KDB27_15200 [Planctomycetales bacterium]|nr:hypothetical protein [Planctomycetales bacterium]